MVSGFIPGTIFVCATSRAGFFLKAFEEVESLGYFLYN